VSGFSGPLDVQILDVSRGGRITARLLQAFGYDPGDGKGPITAPAGFETDFASVPWGLWNFEAPLGDGGKAAVVHDYLYATRGLDGLYSRAEADGVFRKGLADLGVPAWKRALLWAAVRVGGAGGWGR
jgi:hypothetical protein